MTYRFITSANRWLEKKAVPAWSRPVAAITAALCIAIATDYSLPDHSTIEFVFALFFPVVFMAAFFYGVEAGLLTTLVCLILGSVGGPQHGFSSVGGIALFSLCGGLISIVGSWDFDSRRRRDASARVSEDRAAHLQTIFDTAPQAMIVINEIGVVQSYGASAERMFHWRPDEVMGKNISTLMPGKYRHDHDMFLRRYAQTGERRVIGKGRVVVGQRKDGSTFPMHLAVGEVTSERGRFFTGFVQDLTEKEESVARMHALQADLIHISRSNAMGEMASALAHELNQPLSAITNYLRGAERLLAEDQSQGAKAVWALHQAADEALRAGEIIRKLRDFLSRGDAERSFESLATLVHEASQLALVGAKEYNLEVEYRFNSKLDHILVDRVQVQQVVVNLVRNALDAMEDRPLKQLIIATDAMDGAAEVTVSDTGCGVVPEVAQKLFQPFVTSKPEGMGVGLSISRAIVESHGGRLWMEPNPKGGAVFRFTLAYSPALEIVQ